MRILVAALGITLLASVCRAAEVLDGELSSTSIDSIAKALCHEHAWNGARRIGRPATIGQLADHFKSESFPRDLAHCRDEYLEPLEELNKVVNEHQENVCGHQKIELVNKFHWDYIVGGLARKWRRVSDKRAPESLRIFFMQFAHMLAERCKHTLADRLELASSGNEVQSDSLFATKLGHTVDDLSLVLVTQSRVKNYDNFLLLWSQVRAKERKSGRVEAEMLDELYGEPVVSLIKAKDPQGVWEVQRQCRHEFRPIYGDTVLPVMKLLELGYGTVEEKSEEVFRERTALGNWYAITQFCEILLPLSFYRDESLKSGSATIVSDPKEVKRLAREVISPESINQAQVNILPVELDNDNDLMLTLVADNHIVKLVKGNLKQRSRLFRQFFKNVSINMKGRLRDKVKKFFVSKKTQDNHYELVRGDKTIDESEASIKELAATDDDSDGQPPRPEALVRSKRYNLELFVYDTLTVIGIIFIVLIVLGILVCLIGAIVLAIMGG